MNTVEHEQLIRPQQVFGDVYPPTAEDPQPNMRRRVPYAEDGRAGSWSWPPRA